MKVNTTKSKLLSSLLVLALCVTMFAGSTYAWFTDSVTSAGNKIQAGTLQVALYHQEKGGNWIEITDQKEPIFAYENWEPGYTQVKMLKVVNEGTLALKWQAQLASNAGVSSLAEVIDVYVKEFADEGSIVYPDVRGDLSGWHNAGTLKAFIENASTATVGEIEANGSEILGIAFKMQESAGNEYQGLTLGEFDIRIAATQLASEDDSFNDQYDVDADYTDVSGLRKDVTASAPVAASGDTVVKANGITVTVPADSVAAGVQSVGVTAAYVGTADAGNSTPAGVVVEAGQEAVEFDITVTGKEDGKPVTVALAIGKGHDPATVKLYHEGNPTSYDSYDAATGILTFTSAEFSPYTVVYGVKTISNEAELKTALETGSGTYKVVENFTVDADNTITVPAGVNVTLDLNGYKVSGTADGTGNREMFLVKGGNLTVVNGTIEMAATQNQGWGAMSTIFDVTAGGVLEIEKATIKNLGGTDMTFCVHLNNWGEVTLDVNNSTLEAPYVAVRVFNSGYDMNNVTIKNSTLSGGRCFWVHNYTAADFGTQEKADAQKELLNLKIYDNNKFEYTIAAIRLGMTNSIACDAEGNELVMSADALKAAIAAGRKVALGADIDLADTQIEVPAGAEATLNLNGHKLTGEFEGADHYAMFKVVNGAELTVNGAGEVKATTEATENNRSLALFLNAGKLTLNGGTYNLTDSTEGKTWIIATIVDNRTSNASCDAVLTIGGGEYSVSGKAKNLFRNYPQQGGSATIIFNDGTFYDNGNETYIWNQEAGTYPGKLYFNGGTYGDKVVYEDYNGQSDVYIADGVVINAYSGNTN